jgi:signal transduction histidine kinase
LKKASLLSSKSSIALLSIIFISAISLSLISYQYSNSVSKEILDIARQDTASNAKIQARSVSLLLEHQLEAVNSNLESVVHSNSRLDPEALNLVLDSLQHSTQDITDFYLYAGPEGDLVSISNIRDTAKLDKINLISSRYFTEPKYKNSTLFGELATSFDNVLRFYISYPVFTESNGSKKFNGIVAAAIGPDIATNFFQTRFPPEFERNEILIVDNAGDILYSTIQSLSGKNIHDDSLKDNKIMPLIDKFKTEIFNSTIKSSGIVLSDKDETIVGEPVLLSNESFLTTFVRAQNYLTTDMNNLYDNQNTFSTISGIIIGTIAVICTVVLLSWNKRLTVAVALKTEELAKANQSLKESNERFADANEKLSAANYQLSIHDRMQNEFINIASHEIKTPTQAILFYSDLLQAEPERDPLALAAIIRNAYRLQRLTSDILDVTRIESATLKLNKEKFNLCRVIEQILDDFQIRVDSGKLKLFFEPCNIQVYADRERVIQVISNILDNAIKFTLQGIISVTTELVNSHVNVSVRDSGTGMDPSVRPQLFTKFASRSQTGTGLGLFISKNIVEAHGGSMWMEDAVEPKGSIFTFSLPLADSEHYSH